MFKVNDNVSVSLLQDAKNGFRCLVVLGAGETIVFERDRLQGVGSRACQSFDFVSSTRV